MLRESGGWLRWQLEHTSLQRSLLQGVGTPSNQGKKLQHVIVAVSDAHVRRSVRLNLFGMRESATLSELQFLYVIKE